MANTYISRTQANGTSSQIFTVSCWLKRSKLTSTQAFWGTGSASGDGCDLMMSGTDELSFESYDGSNNPKLITTRRFRDVGAWLHIVCAVDTTQATASNRVKLYVNGVQETSFSTANYPSQNYNLMVSTTNDLMKFGVGVQYPTSYWDGSMSYVAFVDGTAELPTVFGETDATTGQWKIKTSITPSVAWGTNGCLLLKNGNSLTDQSTNSNNFALAQGTLTNTEDCPDNNFPTLNPLVPGAKTPIYGNLHIEALYASWKCNTATFGLTKGKWYYEFKLNQLTNYAQVGIVSEYGMELQNDFWGSRSKGYTYNSGTGEYYNNNSGNSYGNSYTASNYMACAMDLDNNKLYFAKDNVWQNSGDPTSGSTGTGAISISQQAGYDMWFPAFSINHCGVDANFGSGYFGTSVAGTNTDANSNGKFKYTPPSGYFSINTKNIKEFG